MYTVQCYYALEFPLNCHHVMVTGYNIFVYRKNGTTVLKEYRLFIPLFNTENQGDKKLGVKDRETLKQYSDKYSKNTAKKL